MDKVLVWSGIIAGIMTVLILWSLLRAGAMADERMEAFIYKKETDKQDGNE